MFSYSWKTGIEYVDSLEEILVKEGYSVWRDKQDNVR
jgi:hypothetical protein